MRSGKLFLIPTDISDVSPRQYLPEYNLEVIRNLKYFFAENIRSARRFISSLGLGIKIETLVFYTLDKNTEPDDISAMAGILLQGENAGLLSEAGSPGIADPGSGLVREAHKKNIRVVPLVGPSSILLALISSGFNGQNFTFNGYLPVRETERVKRIRDLETRMYRENQTQIFMETPYRNETLFKSLTRILKPETMLCIASDLTGPEERIVTRTIMNWKKNPLSIGKIPAIYLIYHN